MMPGHAAPLRVVLAVMGLVFGATGAGAETTDWMFGWQALKVANALAAKKQIVTDVQCKDSGNVGLNFESVLARFTYQPNDRDVVWEVVGGLSLVLMKKYWEGVRGFHLVSVKTFTRSPGGVKIYCTIFEKDPA